MKQKKTRKNKSKGFFKENYRESWQYLKESRNFIYTAIIIFFLFILVGYFFPTPDFIIEAIREFVDDLLAKTEAMSHLELIRFIFLNNLQSSFSGMILGILLGIPSIITLVVNGYVLGFVSSKSVQSQGVFILWRLLPHGIFELPAVLISIGLGLKLGTFIFQKKKIESLKVYLWNSLRVFLFIVIPLLLIAAIIEGSLIFLS